MAGEWIEYLDRLVWGWPRITLLRGTHLYLTVRTGGIQRQVFRGIRLSLSRDPDAAGDVSPFAALATALSASVGTGNIIGVGTAVALGGPGAVLWMWLSGLLGMATRYAETLLAVRYRVRSGTGEMLGGAMYVLERGLNLPWAGIAFAALGAAGAFGIGCMVQADAVMTGVGMLVPAPAPVTAAVLSLLVGTAVFGGIRSIAGVTEKLVPGMAAAYLLGCAAVLAVNRPFLGPAIRMILRSALDLRAAGGGLLGQGAAAACRYGVARGLFSNESGMGSAPLAAVAARTPNPKVQALVSMTGTFWDTCVICLMTGLALMSELARAPAPETISGSELAMAAFSRLPFGERFLALALTVFAFTTILGWCHYGQRCCAYLFGEGCAPWYRALWTAGVFAGALGETEALGSLASLMNGLMAVPNLLSLFLLRREIDRETRRFDGDRLTEKDSRPIPGLGTGNKKRREAFASRRKSSVRDGPDGGSGPPPAGA